MDEAAEIERKFRGWAVIAAVICAVLAWNCGTATRLAPDFSVIGAYGERLRLGSFKGHPLLLVFWNTSCGICRRELPVLDRVAAASPNSSTRIVAINIRDIEGARKFMRERGLRLTNAIDETGEVARAYRVTGVPKFVLIDANGKVVREETGAVSQSTMYDWLAVK